MRSAAQDGKLPGLARTAQPLRALLWAVLVAEGVGGGAGREDQDTCPGLAKVAI